MKSSIWINLIIGIWLLIAAFALPATGLSNARATSDVVLGILLIAFSWWILGSVAPPIGAAWFEIFCGIWLIVAPFVIGYAGTAAAWNDVICGIIAIIVAATAAKALAARPVAA